MEAIILITAIVMLFVGLILGALLQHSAPHLVEMEEPYQPIESDTVKSLKIEIDTESITEHIKQTFEENRVEFNINIVGKFMDHYKTETGKDIPESVFNSFFNV